MVAGGCQSVVMVANATVAIDWHGLRAVANRSQRLPTVANGWQRLPTAANDCQRLIIDWRGIARNCARTHQNVAGSTENAPGTTRKLPRSAPDAPQRSPRGVQRPGVRRAVKAPNLWVQGIIIIALFAHRFLLVAGGGCPPPNNPLQGPYLILM